MIKGASVPGLDWVCLYDKEVNNYWYVIFSITTEASYFGLLQIKSLKIYIMESMLLRK